MSWHQGSKVKLNIYDGDRPVCQTHNEEDAERIVEYQRKAAAYDRLVKWLDDSESLHAAGGSGKFTISTTSYIIRALLEGRDVQ